MSSSVLNDVHGLQVVRLVKDKDFRLGVNSGFLGRGRAWFTENSGCPEAFVDVSF